LSETKVQKGLIMTAASRNVLTKMGDRVFPRMPDFYVLMDGQCDLLAVTMTEFVDFMHTASPQAGARIADGLEKQGDAFKRRTLGSLGNAFATPMDREEIYGAIKGIGHVLNDAKTTAREIKAFDVTPDSYAVEMPLHLQHGAEALRARFRKFATAPNAAVADTQVPRKAERQIEKTCHGAIFTATCPTAATGWRMRGRPCMTSSSRSLDHIGASRTLPCAKS
jgi:hypothetical protein